MARRKKDQDTDLNYDAIAAQPTTEGKSEVINNQLNSVPVPSITDAITHRNRGGQLILETLNKEADRGRYNPEKRSTEPRRVWKLRVLKIKEDGRLRDPKPGDKIEVVTDRTNRLPSGKKIGTTKMDEFRRMGKDTFTRYQTLEVDNSLCVSCEYAIAAQLLTQFGRHYKSKIPLNGYPQDILYEEFVEYEEEEKGVNRGNSK